MFKVNNKDTERRHWIIILNTHFKSRLHTGDQTKLTTFIYVKNIAVTLCICYKIVVTIFVVMKKNSLHLFANLLLNLQKLLFAVGHLKRVLHFNLILFTFPGFCTILTQFDRIPGRLKLLFGMDGKNMPNYT